MNSLLYTPGGALSKEHVRQTLRKIVKSPINPTYWECVREGAGEGERGASPTVVNDTVRCVMDTGHPGSPNNKRILTFEVKIPFPVHPELMTHRAFSRNAASQRGIPVTATIKRIEQEDYLVPAAAGLVYNQSGMQGFKKMSAKDAARFRELWTDAAQNAIRIAKQMTEETNCHKQFINRILAPYRLIDVVVTTTNEGINNFISQRDSMWATYEMQQIAKGFKEYLENNSPIYRPAHLPYLRCEDIVEAQKVASVEGIDAGTEVICAASVARCARVSYAKHGTTLVNLSNDLTLYRELLRVCVEEQKDVHPSPFEHAAFIAEPHCYFYNFGGFMSLRYAEGF